MNIKNLDEQVRKLTNFELAYALGMYLNDKYSTGGYSLGRSNRSYLLDLFFRLNQNQDTKAVQQIDPFENQELFLQEISKRLEQNEKKEGQMSLNLTEELDISNKKVFSAVILRLWIQHYQEEIERNEQLDYVTDKNFSFEAEIERAKSLYDLYLSGLNIDDSQLDKEAQKYVENANHKYTTELRWHVDDLCNLSDDL